MKLLVRSMESSPLWMNCKYVWIWKLVYSYFWGELGLIVGWFWCRVCGILRGLNWEDIVAGGQGLFRDGFGSKTGMYRSGQGILWHAKAWNPCRSVAGYLLWHAGAWNPRRSVAGAPSGTPGRGIPRYSVAPAQC